MPWEPPDRRKSKTLLRSLPFSAEGHRHSRRYVLRLVLLGIFTIGFWHTLQRTPSPQFRADYSLQCFFNEFAECVSADKASHKSVVGKVHAVFGEPNPSYERALGLQKAHAALHRHPLFLLRKRITSGLWNKPAFILSTILQELEKPEEKRLKWLMWIDADVVIMNPQISLDIFIPPSPKFDHVNIVYTRDQNGLNNGVFLIKVNVWSARLLSGVLSFHTFRPEKELKYSEQSALEEMVVRDPYWSRNAVEAPQHWFNSYPATSLATGHTKDHEFRAGGLQAHFVGNKDGKRPERMNAWLAVADQHLPQYSMPVEKTTLLEDMARFWAKLSQERLDAGTSDKDFKDMHMQDAWKHHDHNDIIDPW